LTGDGSTGDRPQPATIFIENGKIAAIEPFDTPHQGLTVLDVGDAVVMPGLVDSHVHINDPGRSHWEGFESATRAAAAGGVTTLVDMPLNSSPVTTTAAALATKAEAAAGRCRVDYGFWGGVVPGNEDALLPLLQGGVLGFKAFLVDSGLDEFPASGEQELRAALRHGAEHGSVLLAHAEAPSVIEEAKIDSSKRRLSKRPLSKTRLYQAYQAYLESRPPRAEVEAIELLASLSRETRGAIHIVHVASEEALKAVARARAEKIPLTAETCPHYLTFSAEEAESTLFKCAPPIRQAAHREALWKGLLQSQLDLVATDHSPCPPEMKEGDLFQAWGGISSLQLLLPATWTEGRRRGASLKHLVSWLSQSPARLAGLDDRKGRIAPGYDADLVIWDPDRWWTVDGETLHHRHPLTPYQGRRLQGVVQRTILRGQTIYQARQSSEGHFPGSPEGKWQKGHWAESSGAESSGEDV